MPDPVATPAAADLNGLNTPVKEAVKESPAPAAPPELDYEALLVVGAKDAKDAKPKDEAKGATDGAAAATAADPADDVTAAAATEPPDTESAEAPKPGTPDKALQKLQQDQAAALRKIEELGAKIEAGVKPTADDKAALQTAKRKLDAVREGLKAKGAEFDLLEHDAAVAESLLEHDDQLTATQAELTETKRRLAALEQRGQAADAAALWADHEARYPGVAVKAVWQKAVADAAELLGVDPAKAAGDLADALESAASRIFHNRAAATVASKAGKQQQGDAAAAKPGKPPTTRTAADPTPNGGRVTGGGAHPATGEVSEDTAYVSRAMSLVK